MTSVFAPWRAARVGLHCCIAPMLYFDNNATTRIDPLVLEAMLPYLGELYGNPSSGCRLGKRPTNSLPTRADGRR